MNLLKILFVVDITEQNKKLKIAKCVFLITGETWLNPYRTILYVTYKGKLYGTYMRSIYISYMLCIWILNANEM